MGKRDKYNVWKSDQTVCQTTFTNSRTWADGTRNTVITAVHVDFSPVKVDSPVYLSPIHVKGRKAELNRMQRMTK